ncbi:MAG TPA: hypothetical protein VJ044_18040, partial [Candidatus Hodarchaeales archaeon]|nr:hypothetical protein [Candidatus Hodarchaeales archaeon]
IWLFDNWAYYQDIYLGFFFTAAIYFQFRSGRSTILRHRQYYLLLTSLSIILSMYTKLSAWLLLVLLPLFLPASRYGLRLKFLLMGIYAMFLSAQVSSKVFIGYFPVIVLLVFVSALKLQAVQKNEFKGVKVSSSLSVLALSVVLGSFWILNMFSRFPEALDEFVHRYLEPSLEVVTVFTPNNPANASFIIETAQSADFFASVLILLIGNYFAVFLLLPKIAGFLEADETAVFSIWVFLFLALWLTYYGAGSIRYLTPVITPMVIIIYRGGLRLKTWIDSRVKVYRKRQDFATAGSLTIYWFVLIILGLSTVYFPIPLERLISIDESGAAIGHAYIESAFLYYSNWWILLGFVVLLNGTIIAIVYQFSKRMTNFRPLAPKFISKTSISLFLIVFMVAIPSAVPLTNLAWNSGDLESFQQDYSFENRKSVQEVVDFLEGDNPSKDGVITVSLPGISVWTGIPSVDITTLGTLPNRILSTENISQSLEGLLNPLDFFSQGKESQLSSQFTIKYVILPAPRNFFYPYFERSLKSDYFLFSLVYDPRYFQKSYENEEFIVFKRVFEIPRFIG